MSCPCVIDVSSTIDFPSIISLFSKISPTPEKCFLLEYVFLGFMLPGFSTLSSVINPNSGIMYCPLLIFLFPHIGQDEFVSLVVDISCFLK